MWVSLRKLIPGFHFYITEINSKHQSSFLLSLKLELMLFLAILNILQILQHLPVPIGHVVKSFEVVIIPVSYL